VRADATGIQGLKKRCTIQHKTRILAGFPLRIRVKFCSKQARVDWCEGVRMQTCSSNVRSSSVMRGNSL
jgi:hypothetical protein